MKAKDNRIIDRILEPALTQSIIDLNSSVLTILSPSVNISCDVLSMLENHLTFSSAPPHRSMTLAFGDYLKLSMPKSTQFPPPPGHEIDRFNTDAQLLQLAGIQVAIVGSQRAVGPGVPTILDCDDAIGGQRHDLAQRLAYLVLCHAVVAAELQDRGQWAGVAGEVDADARNVGGVCGRADRPVVHLYGLMLTALALALVFLVLFLRLPQHVDQDVDGRFGVVVVRHRVAVQDGHAEDRRVRAVFLHGAFAVEFRLAVDVGRFGCRRCRVRRLAFDAGEDVVRRDVDQKGVVGRRCLREVLGRRDVQFACGFRVAGA